MSTRPRRRFAPPDPDDDLLTPGQLAAESNGIFSDRTLEQWRRVGRGPAFIKLGRRIVYRRRDWRAWLDAQTRRHTAEEVSA